MYLRITSLEYTIFDWEVRSITIPWEAGEFTVLPNHVPLTSSTKGGIVKILPKDHEASFIQSWDFLFDDDKISISVSKWLFFTDGTVNVLTVSSATSSPEESKEVLEKMKENLKEELDKLKKDWSLEDIEKATSELDKINADIKLTQFK